MFSSKLMTRLPNEYLECFCSRFLSSAKIAIEANPRNTRAINPKMAKLKVNTIRIAYTGSRLIMSTDNECRVNMREAIISMPKIT